MQKVTCVKCSTEFDLYKFGAPGDPTRDICWACKPPVYARSARKLAICSSWAELDALEDRCIREIDV